MKETFLYKALYAIDTPGARTAGRSDPFLSFSLQKTRTSIRTL